MEDKYCYEIISSLAKLINDNFILSDSTPLSLDEYIISHGKLYDAVTLLMPSNGRTENLKDNNTSTGVCVDASESWIVAKFTMPVTINKIKVAGWHGNTNTWGPSNGTGGIIEVLDNNGTWKNIGTIPNLDSTMELTNRLISHKAF